MRVVWVCYSVVDCACGASEDALATAVPTEKSMERAEAAMAAMRSADMSLLLWSALWSASVGWAASAAADMVCAPALVLAMHV